MSSFSLTICALSMVLGDLTTSFILPAGQRWTMIGYLNMSDPTQQCPGAWQNFTSAPVASCVKNANVLCDSVNLSTSGASYQTVCGRFLGYQVGTPDAFSSYQRLGWDIEKYYVDGVSITYGSPGNRHHVFTYVAGWNEYQHSVSCPCAGGQLPPQFVGSDYYCESGNSGTTWDWSWTTAFYDVDILWDRQLCRNNEVTCCDPPNLPWFCKTFPTLITENIEVRLCLDEIPGFENVALQFFELYIGLGKMLS